jgi:hypothetical protein
MRWIKRGLIFSPIEHKLSNNCTEFAQSPQAVIFPDFVRVYFSTRERVNDKYLSHIAYVDYDRNMEKALQVSDHQVITLGKLGCFDEHGIFPISPVLVGDKVYAYTCGWSQRVSVSVETSIGLAISEDNGETFTRFGDGPILSASVNEPMLVGDGFVKEYDGQFHMWYIFGKEWLTETANEPPARVYKIGYASSSNGIEWKKNDGAEIIQSVLGPDECQALPSILKIGKLYHMVFCYRHATDFRTNPTRAYKLGYAYSSDLVSWTRNDSLLGLNFTDPSWDNEMQCYPNIFNIGNKVFLLYNGNQFGRFGFGLAELLDSH